MEDVKNYRQALSSQLKIGTKEIGSDIRQLAWSWEVIVGYPVVPDPKQVINSLLALGKSYLRGRGIRMGSYQSFLKNNVILLQFCTEIIREVMDGSPILYPALHKVGFTSWESAATLFGRDIGGHDIVKEAEDILREKQ